MTKRDDLIEELRRSRRRWRSLAIAALVALGAAGVGLNVEQARVERERAAAVAAHVRALAESRGDVLVDAPRATNSQAR